MVTTTNGEPALSGDPAPEAHPASYDADPGRDPEPIPLDQVPDVCSALDRMGIARFADEAPAARPGRNDNWAGRTEDGREIFVKRITGDRVAALARFDRERAAHAFLAAEAGAVAVRTPALLGADREALVLVYERLEDAEAGSRLAEDGHFGEERCAEAGHLVGTLHAQPVHALPVSLGTDTARDPLRGWRASGLSCLDLRRYTASSAGELGVWELLQHDRRLHRALGDLSASSSRAPVVPCHSDLRLDQFLRTGRTLHLVDWEEFGPADPARDVGGFAGEWLYRAARRMFTELDTEGDGVVDDTHGAFMHSGRQQLDAVRPLVAAFWRGYRAARGPAADRALAERAVAFAGWHLFDRVFAAAVHASRVTEVSRGIAGVGRSALLTPARFMATVGLADETDHAHGHGERDRECV